MKLQSIKSVFTPIFVLLSIFYLLTLIFFFLYSFTQVDLNLTLSRISLLYGFQDYFQYIGYFLRPLSAQLYLWLIIFLFVLFFVTLYFVKRNKISIKQFGILIGLVVFILFLSYPAFSYDIFNYMFDAKIVTTYYENPYIHKALDYPADPWLNFMRWTHRTYPYGPVWLVLTVPLSFIGFEHLIPTLALFKLLAIISYVISTVLIYKILKLINTTYVLLGTAFFALNPLVIIESLVSAHNDIVMVMFTLLSFYLLVRKKYTASFLALFLSIGIKFASLFLLPIYTGVLVLQKYNKKFRWDTVVLLVILLMTFAIIGACIRTQFQPWYLLYILPFASLLIHKYYVVIPAVILSIAGLLQYIPYLYTGNWDPPIPTILNYIILTGIAFSILLILGWRAVRSNQQMNKSTNQQ